MSRKIRRKCLHCEELFRPDYRVGDRQRYCSKPECKRASKAASQRRWLSKPENVSYFQGAAAVARTQAWRKAHPGYWRGKPEITDDALKDECHSQPSEDQEDTASSPQDTSLGLQDEWFLQPPLIYGLISSLIGSALQENIVMYIRQLQARGQRILGKGPGFPNPGDDHDRKEALVSAASPAGTGTVQLGGSSAGSR